MTWEPQPPPTVTVESAVQPVGTPGLLWIDTSDPGRPAFHRWDDDTETFVQVGGRSTVRYQDDPPNDPRQGDVFIDRAPTSMVDADGIRE